MGLGGLAPYPGLPQGPPCRNYPRYKANMPFSKAHKVGIGTRFMPGHSGNPGGRPKKKPITEAYERRLKDPAIADAIAASMITAAQMGNVNAVKEMTDRVEGKVQERVNEGQESSSRLPQFVINLGFLGTKEASRVLRKASLTGVAGLIDMGEEVDEDGGREGPE